MSIVLADRVQETTTTTGTGTINLGGPVTQFQSFVSGVGNGNQTYYCIVSDNTTSWEVGIGTVTAGTPNTLSRTTILASSNGGSAINLSGLSTVFGNAPAALLGILANGTTGSGQVALAETPTINGPSLGDTVSFSVGSVDSAGLNFAADGSANPYWQAATLWEQNNTIGKSATVTITIASPAVVTWTAHGFSSVVPQAVSFETTGTLPTGLSSASASPPGIYYTIPATITANTFEIASSYANALANTPIDTSGSQSGTQTGNTVGNIYQTSTFAILRSSNGSGVNGPSNSDAALTLGLSKNNYMTTTLQGELDALFVYTEQSRKGDTDVFSAQLKHMDDGGTNPNYGRNLFEGLNSSLTTAAGNAVLISLDTRFGSITTTPTLSDTPVSSGYIAEAQQGINGVAFLADTEDTSGGANIPSWTDFLRLRSNRSNASTLAHINGAGQMALGAASGGVWRLDVQDGSGHGVRCLSTGSAESLFLIDNSSSSANSVLSFSTGGTAKFDLFYQGSNGAFIIYDTTNGTLFQGIGGNVTVGITGKDTSVLGSVSMPNLPGSDPHVVGQLWQNSGVVTVSAG